jgi:hypothetical protein
MNNASSDQTENPGASAQHDTHQEDAREVAALREAIRRLDPLNLPVPRIEKERRRRMPGYRTRSLLGAGLLLLVVSLALDTESQLPVIELGSDVAVRESNTGSDKMLTGAPALSMAWMPELVLAEGVDLPAGDGEVYRLDQLDEERLEQFAAILVPGLATEQIPVTEGGGLRSKSADGTAGFAISGNGSWWYSAAAAAVSCAVTPVEPRPATPEASPTATPAPDAAGQGAGCAVERRTLPADADALGVVAGIADELRLGTGDASIEYRDDRSLTVRWDPSIPDVRFGETNPLSSRFGLGEEGALEYAGGQYALLERVGTYPTVSAAEALDTLNRTHTHPEVSGPLVACQDAIEVADTGVATTGDVVEDPASSGSAGGSGGGQEPVVSGPVDAACGPTVSTTLLVTAVVRVHTLVWDVSGTGWLVPAYEYRTEDGATWIADALPEKYLDRQGTADRNTTKDTLVVDDTLTVDSDGAAVAGWPGVGGLIGMTAAEAERIVASAGLVSRVVTEDAATQPGTKDTREDRVNLVVTDGTVTDAWLG